LSATIASEPLRQATVPVCDGWFEDGFGKPAARTQFEYIQDHLGYRLELQSARIQAREGGKRVQVKSNWSTEVSPRSTTPPGLSRADGLHWERYELAVPAADRSSDADFRPDDAIQADCPPDRGAGICDRPTGLYRSVMASGAARSLRRDPRYAIRAANQDVPWWTDVHGRYASTSWAPAVVP
jgi:hypothetical protein